MAEPMLPAVTIVLATSNEGKASELRGLLADLPVQLVTTAEVLGEKLTLPEDGDTFEANAIQKAKAICAATRMIALADDSGLEVDALGGRPGVRSARFAHERATDAENNAALLRALEEAERGHERTARFRCVLALASPWLADVKTSEGRIEGTIARDPRGSGGFGYDPLFLATEADGRAMAELTEGEKNCISHRARAVRALRPVLIAVMNLQLDEAERIAG
ncbi:MAG: RdgB/HAM1 family non-canonical purine NTP pyrophosphatase [Polyangiaceae bacterium]|jgi:XTP/dITP diphosphohydrolase|nr:RdgB/HAM1 family non-canonical purine NTP pyrophosphatase [Polyangiaceae bacterium]